MIFRNVTKLRSEYLFEISNKMEYKDQISQILGYNCIFYEYKMEDGYDLFIYQLKMRGSDSDRYQFFNSKLIEISQIGFQMTLMNDIWLGRSIHLYKKSIKDNSAILRKERNELYRKINDLEKRLEELKN